MIGYWDTLTKYPGLYATYTFSKTMHDGLPASDLVMSEANSQRLGAYKLAPGYT
jgi:branched-chain amino acid transport system substrate-binding protein